MKHSGADYSAELTSRAWNTFVSRFYSVAHGGEESIASADAGVFRAERASRSVDAARNPTMGSTFPRPPILVGSYSPQLSLFF